ncbi:hypothetical protein N657DRAFT_676887 [Parathielavia appendiculata]|uniref:DUF1772-domain-containing protein n=1 Tax=Parathielavia appendiculata TaxID=2587402 RepID=A0AAN6UAI2_9PEZI|nr:hypothetical protein N657DRAFT_676887 [Parathielavia appendiculata]
MSTPPSGSDATLRLARGTALLLSSLSSGIVLSLSAFLVPRLLESPTPLMLAQWQRTFQLGASTMPLTGAVSAAAYFWLGLRGLRAPGGAIVVAGDGLSGLSRARLLLAAGALSVGIVPYTILVMSGTNGKLKALRERVGGAAVKKGAERELVAEEERSAKWLVDHWGMLNLGRAGLLIAGTVCGLVATL